MPSLRWRYQSATKCYHVCVWNVLTRIFHTNERSQSLKEITPRQAALHTRTVQNCKKIRSLYSNKQAIFHGKLRYFKQIISSKLSFHIKLINAAKRNINQAFICHHILALAPGFQAYIIQNFSTMNQNILIRFNQRKTNK